MAKDIRAKIFEYDELECEAVIKTYLTTASEFNPIAASFGYNEMPGTAKLRNEDDRHTIPVMHVDS